MEHMLECSIVQEAVNRACKGAVFVMHALGVFVADG